MKETKFWMLYVEGGNAPTFAHRTIASARAEAERLAEKLGKKVYVLEAVSVCELKKCQWDTLAALLLPF